ncbi:Golgin candidate 2 [Morella rubra]|uniref:Golgin candidate 2 n=1 Tax=Morella rubra TaxID=262757 RepID=A0A6A1VK65_9ROSI|nr:Golgin candidate 2 [Morella rubra]
MANWISSKLKAAESILHQIDQQAADSLRKNERCPTDELNVDTPTKSGGVVPLKDQLRKKTQENNDYHGYSQSDPNFCTNGQDKDTSDTPKSSPRPNQDKEISDTPKPSPRPKSTLTDSDWTELLSTPTKSTSSGVNRSNGGTAIRGLRNKDDKRQVSLGSSSLVSAAKRSQKNSTNVMKPGRRLGDKNQLNGKVGDGEESSSSDSVGRSSNVDLQADVKYLGGQESDGNKTGVDLVGKPKNKGNEENGGHLDSKAMSSENSPWSMSKNKPMEMISVLGKVDGVSDVKMGMDNVQGRLKSTIRGKHKTIVDSRSSVSDDLKRGSSSTSHGSSDSDSGSTSDSESEREREEKKRRREKILAEKAAARAVEAIKERENVVARLEGEKQSLEKILEERAKEQAQEGPKQGIIVLGEIEGSQSELIDEQPTGWKGHSDREETNKMETRASRLQTTMMETLEAVDFEKRKHNNTRKEAFGRLAKLEVTKAQKFLQTANVDLARSLAAAQWNLEAQVNHIAELRQRIDLNQATHEELRRRISHSDQTGTSLKQLAASRGIEIEREILEAEYNSIADKVAQLQDKARMLEATIEMTRKEIEDPTEVEIELKRRLGQMTDHLIQKQAQVEALSSEKATLQFRIEAVSRWLDENKSSASSRDLESGTWALSESKFGPLVRDRIRSGRKHLGSLVQQLDAIFLAGEVFLRRNSKAQLWSLVYLLCLHFWVIYIFMSHSQESNGAKSGAVISLENINNTSGV